MTFETCKLFINGEWVSSSATETSPVYNPSEGVQIAATPMCGSDEIGHAIEAESSNSRCASIANKIMLEGERTVRRLDDCTHISVRHRRDGRINSETLCDIGCHRA